MEREERERRRRVACCHHPDWLKPLIYCYHQVQGLRSLVSLPHFKTCPFLSVFHLSDSAFDPSSAAKRSRTFPLQRKSHPKGGRFLHRALESSLLCIRTTAHSRKSGTQGHRGRFKQVPKPSDCLFTGDYPLPLLEKKTDRRFRPSLNLTQSLNRLLLGSAGNFKVETTAKIMICILVFCESRLQASLSFTLDLTSFNFLVDHSQTFKGLSKVKQPAIRSVFVRDEDSVSRRGRTRLRKEDQELVRKQSRDDSNLLLSSGYRFSRFFGSKRNGEKIRYFFTAITSKRLCRLPL